MRTLSRLLRTYGLLAALLFGSGAQAQSLATVPSPPIGYVPFRIHVLATMSGSDADIGVSVTESFIRVWLNHSCTATPCGQETLQNRSVELTLQPGPYEVFVYASRRPEDATPLLHRQVVVANRNLATIDADPGLAFVPGMASVTAYWPTALPGIAPTTEVRGDQLVVYLRANCATTACAPGGAATYSFPVPALAPGVYQVTVHPYAKSTPPYPYIPATGRLTIVPGRNYQGLWWAYPPGYESGWGLQISHQEETLFVTWYTYDRDGTPTWFVMPAGRRAGDGLYRGDLYRASGPPSQDKFDLTASTETKREGTAYFQFSGPDDGVFGYEVRGVRQVKPITRQLFGATNTRCAYGTPRAGPTSYQDLWWNAPAGSESGWGVQVAHQDTTLFATFFGYDSAGIARWLVMPQGREVAPGRYAGDVYSTRGPTYDTIPWSPSQVSIQLEGRAEFTFTGYSDGAFTLTGPGLSERKSITRQVFAAYPTACN